MGRSNKRKRNKKLSKQRIEQLLKEKGVRNMTVDQTNFSKQINILIGEIQKKDERFNVQRLERTIFEKNNVISKAADRNTPTSVERYRAIISALTNFKNSMKDYSNISTDELIKRVKNLIKNKGYSQSEVSKRMGKSDTYVASSISQKSRSPLLNIYDFVELLTKKTENEKVIKKTECRTPTSPVSTVFNEQKNTEEDGTIFVAKLTLNGETYYLENLQEGKLHFANTTSNAEWFTEKPFVEADVMTGRKKVVVEFD